MNGEHPSPLTAEDRQTLRGLSKFMQSAFSDKDMASVLSRHDAAWLRWFKRNAKRKAQKR